MTENDQIRLDAMKELSREDGYMMGRNDAIMNKDGTVTFPLSSEEPYRRYYWEHGELDEILSHDPSAVDMSFIKSGNAPALDTHKRRELNNVVGVVSNAELRDKRLYVTVKFSNRAHAQEVMADVRDGIIRNVSVGYEIMKYEIDEKADTLTATRWMPKEASFVPLPADATVGIGRTAERKIMTAKTMPGAEPEQQTDEERAEAMTSSINEITALAQTHNCADLGRSFIEGAVKRGENPSLALFKGIVAAKLPEGTPLVNNDIGLTENERQSFSILNLARRLQNPEYRGAEFELEAAAAAAERLDVEVQGFALPTDLMNSWGRFVVDGVDYGRNSQKVMGEVRQMSRAAVATGSNANILTTDHLADRFIDNLRNQSSLLRAGVTVMEGLSSDIEIPGGDQNIAAAWLASEGANAAESVPTFRKVTMSPKDVAAYTDVTRRMLQQSTIAIEAYIRAQLIEAHRIAIDYAGVYGSGADGIPEGLVNTTGIGSVTFATENQPTRNEIIDMEVLVDLTNRAGDVTHLGNSQMYGHMRKTPVLAGGNVARFLSDEFGESFLKSNQISQGDLVSGVFEDMIMGMWGGLQLDRSTEALFLSGGVRLRSIQTVDFCVTRVGSFVLGQESQA